MTRIEQIISEIEEYVDGCKFKPLSSTKIIVNKAEIEELISELRLKTPDEIKKYQKMLNNKDAILDDARRKAELMIQQANEQTKELVSEHEIMQQAYIKANAQLQQAAEQAAEIVDEAKLQANSLRDGIIGYSDDMLANLENIIVRTMENVTNKYEGFMESLNASYEVIKTNREEFRKQNLQANVQETADDNSNDEENNETGEDYQDYTVNINE